MDIKLILGDCLTELKKISENSVDLIVTSPPYNKNGFRGKRDTSRGKGRWSGADIYYDEYMDDMDEKAYKDWQTSVLDECYRVIRPTGSILYNHKVRRASGRASHPMEWLLRCKARFYQQIIWDRGSGPDHNIGYLDPTTELIFWLVKETPKCHKDKNWATEVWRIPPIPTDNDHPAPFPKKLCKAAILTTTDEGDTVLDPFMGSGTAGVVAKELGRNFIGIELNPKYIEIAKDRINKVIGNVFNHSLRGILK
jgi:modification methylase